MNGVAEVQPSESLSEDIRSCWRRLPDKGMFFTLLGAWLLLFHFLGNSTFGYVNTNSLLGWMYNAYANSGPAGDDGHGMFIPFVVLGLFWWKRDQLLSVTTRNWWPGLAIVVFALVLHVVGYKIQQSRIGIVALFMGIYGFIGLIWGPRFLMLSFFPFVLFAFMMPLGSLTEFITFPLRLLVSKIVAFIGQQLLAINVVADGTRLLKMPWGFEYEVAAACSGIRSLIAITAIAIIYAFTTFTGVWRRAVLLASAVPLAVAGNTFRMLVIVIAAEWGGQQAGARAHESAVWSMLPYIPAILGLMALGRWLERFGPKPASDENLNAKEAQT